MDHMTVAKEDYKFWIERINDLEDEIERLEYKYDCLHMFGLARWEGYHEALEKYSEKYPTT